MAERKKALEEEEMAELSPRGKRGDQVRGDQVRGDQLGLTPIPNYHNHNPNTNYKQFGSIKTLKQ